MGRVTKIKGKNRKKERREPYDAEIMQNTDSKSDQKKQR